jgi:hypothetical protein
VLPEAGDHVTCDCHCPKIEKKTLGEDQSEAAWSRLGPMGPLLDPKVYPVKVGVSPESQVSRYDQPNVYLQKLKEQYPYLYECLSNAPPDDLISRINRDRLRTTYQVDYCKMRKTRFKEFLQINRVIVFFAQRNILTLHMTIC